MPGPGTAAVGTRALCRVRRHQLTGSAHAGGHFARAAPTSLYHWALLRTASAQSEVRRTRTGKEKAVCAGVGCGVGERKLTQEIHS